MFNALFNKKTTITGLVLLALLLLGPQVLPRFYIYLGALMFAIALLATSLNLVLGFGGMYQFHHAVFYGVGAYAFALFATKSGLPIWIGYLIAPFTSACCKFHSGPWSGPSRIDGIPLQEATMESTACPCRI